MTSTRDKILQSLLRHPRAAIQELADEVGINPISVRHHLSSLQMAGLIDAEEERHGVGRPRQVYSLTENGMERFPTRYLRLTTRLLTQMKEKLPGEVISAMFSDVASDLAERHEAQLRDMNVEERLNTIKDLLAEEGFVVEWEKKGNTYHIHEITCPYLQIGQNHPEVCAVDQTLLSRLLSVPAEKVQCILSGAAHCTYVVAENNGVSKAG